MFHCNGWTYPWAVTAVGGTHVCLRRVDPALIFPADRRAPRHPPVRRARSVLSMLIHAPAEQRQRFEHRCEMATGGAAPPPTVIAGHGAMGFRVHPPLRPDRVYGPATLCAWQDEWDALALEERAAVMARQGVGYPTLDGLMVADPRRCEPVPRDGKTMGEVMLRGNTVMKGYLKNPAATTEAAFSGGWFHYGRPGGLAPRRLHRDQGPLEGHHHLGWGEHLLARGGGGRSSGIPADGVPRWWRVPTRSGARRPARSSRSSRALPIDAAEITALVPRAPRALQGAAHVVFGPLPKTSTGKIQKYVLRERVREL